MTEFREKSLEVTYIDEPALEFGHGQTTDHPKDGLYLFGPRTPKPLRKTITLGIVGTPKGLSHFRNWAIQLSGGVNVPERTEREKKDRLHLSDFPGIEEAFGINFDPKSSVERPIKHKDIERLTSLENQHEAVSKTVDLFIEEVTRHHNEEEQSVDVWLFVLPEIIFERCKRQARRTGVQLSPGDYARKQKTRSNLPLLADVIDITKENVFDDIPDFHRQVKARLLHHGHTSQLVRETTLAPNEFLNRAGYPIRGTQDPATVAWNLATGIFYKTQPEPPWKIASMRPGVCYVGLVFKILPNNPKNHVCCAAQMFLSEGDGVVFRGANGPWKTSEYEFHLSKEAAVKLLTSVLGTYKQKYGEYPKQLFIHGRTNFNRDEWDAFEEAAPAGTDIVGVRIKSTSGEMKLFRAGDYPCMRGTAILLDDSNAFLWTSGYVPRLDTYIGPETPNPLSITVLRSTGDRPELRDVLTDIMGLTKINYNACNYSDSIPVTIRFADKVGDVLVTGSAEGANRQPFKFYV
tara:strand:+ start:2116 stop:3672 length:1557 start_codon:yes stop_codon:yes gene_type:complete